ncbi:hypothetical protein M1293_00465 [Candidatus Parvarchaeota archaeon]|nr:hypothetical protein [Candidatus Parvarchaeota archaeon]
MQRFKEGDIVFFAEDNQTRKSSVFFNPERKWDRDLNVLLAESIGAKEMDGIDLFSSSGIRGLRLASETGVFRSMLLNDIKTHKILTRNVRLNKDRIRCALKISSFNASRLRCIDGVYDYIDIDPFGSPVRYILDAVCKLRLGGIMAITATDTAALYGKAKKACMLRYGSTSMKTSYFNELGLRILIKRSEELANIQERSVEPVFFDVRRHYIRVYLRICKPRSGVQTGFFYQCSRCPNRSRELMEKCDVCGKKMVQIGPIWLGGLLDKQVLRKMSVIAEEDAVKRHLGRLLSEKDKIVSYYTTTELASYKRKPERPVSYFYDRTIFNPKGFKTNKSLKELSY